MEKTKHRHLDNFALARTAVAHPDFLLQQFSANEAIKYANARRDSAAGQVKNAEELLAASVRRGDKLAANDYRNRLVRWQFEFSQASDAALAAAKLSEAIHTKIISE